MAAKRYREKFAFWLDLSKDNEFALADQVGELKKERKFANTIRDGIRLICDLRAGKVNVLFELFPWVKAEFLAGVASVPQTTTESAIQRQLQRLEKMLLEQHAAASMPTRTPLKSNGPQPLQVAAFDLPRLVEDDEETLILRKDTSTESALNFLESMFALQQ